MEKFKFSKGEWEPQIEPDDAYVTCGDFLIADLLCSDVEESEMDANTRLIAAAPDMYNMLKVVRDGHLNLIEFDLVDHQYRDDLQDVVDRIDALLSKARGER